MKTYGFQTFPLRYPRGKDHGELQVQFTPKIGMFEYALVSSPWSEIYAGPTISPTNWMQIGAGAGLETSTDNPTALRWAGFLWMGKGKFSYLHLFEKGQSGEWSKAQLNFQAGKDVTVGLQGRGFVGIGPTINAHIPQTPVNVETFIPVYQSGKGIQTPNKILVKVEGKF